VARALVTGAHGALGRYVARSLARTGFQVRGLGHGGLDPQQASEFGISFWHAADVTLESLTTYAEEPDVIVHCAGSASVGFSVLHPFQDYLRTVASTAAVLEYVRLNSRHTRIVYPSSAAVYGSAPSLPIPESAPLTPASPYGVHKLMAEQLCRSYGPSYGLQVAIIRLFSVYGEGFRKQLLWDACRKAVAGDFLFSGSGAEIRDWLHVEDAASLLHRAIDLAAPSVPAINGGYGAGVTVRDAVTEIFQSLNPQLQPRFSGTPRPGDPPGYVADTTQITALNWRPAIDWQTGVARYIHWFKKTMQS
jgi:UDP-glucose 4-epimerase